MNVGYGLLNSIGVNSNPISTGVVYAKATPRSMYAMSPVFKVGRLPAPYTPPSFVIPADSPLIPPGSGLGPGDRSRLTFLSDTRTRLENPDLSHYDTLVQTDARNGGFFRPKDNAPDHFKAVVCGETVDADIRTHMFGQGDVPVYWLNGGKIADNHAGFYGARWENTGFNSRTADGNAVRGSAVFTGCNGPKGRTDGTNHPGSTNDRNVRAISWISSLAYKGDELASTANPLRIVAMSPVFAIKLPTPSVQAKRAAHASGNGPGGRATDLHPGSADARRPRQPHGAWQQGAAHRGLLRLLRPCELGSRARRRGAFPLVRPSEPYRHEDRADHQLDEHHSVDEHHSAYPGRRHGSRRPSLYLDTRPGDSSQRRARFLHHG